MPIYPAQQGPQQQRLQRRPQPQRPQRQLPSSAGQRRQPDPGLLRQFMQPGPARGMGAPRPSGPTSPMYSSPTNFSQTPAGRAILQRVLQQYTDRRRMGPGR